MIDIFNKYNLYMKNDFLKDVKEINITNKEIVLIFNSENKITEYIPNSKKISAHDKMEIALRRLRRQIFIINKTNLLNLSKTQDFFYRCQK